MSAERFEPPEGRRWAQSTPKPSRRAGHSSIFHYPTPPLLKAIIPIAGAGKRLRPFTYTQPKPLIPVAGKPILSYIIEQLRDLGVREYVFVLGYLGSKVKDFVLENFPEIEPRFVIQADRRGSGHAIWLAEEAVADTKEVVIAFGDTLLEGPIDKVVHCEHTCLAIKPVDDPRAFGVVEVDKRGHVRGMAEKPRMPRGNNAMVGLYKISDYGALHASLTQVLAEAPSPSVEVTLSDGLINLLDRGHVMHTEQVDRWYDCGNAEVLLATNRALLEKRGYGETQLPAFDRTILVHPVTIGKGCRISDAIIGPHASIGDFATIDRTIVSDAIVGRYARLHEVNLEHSIVGNDTILTGQARRINIGDHTELSLE